MFGKSEIRQNLLTRRHFQYFCPFMGPRRRVIVLKLHPIALIYSRALNLAKRAVRKLFNTIGGFLDQKSVPTFGISCRDSISQNSISSHGIELNLSGLSRYIKYSAKQSFLTSQTCSKVDFSMNQYWVLYPLGINILGGVMQMVEKFSRKTESFAHHRPVCQGWSWFRIALNC